MNWNMLILLVSLVSFGILEYLYPFFTYKQSWTSRIATNFALGLLNTVLSKLVIVALLTWVWHQQTWPGLFHAIPIPWIVGVLSFLVLDIYRYGWHVLMHLWPLGWRFHRVHHSERAMNISTAYRFHFIEVMVSYFPLIFLIWLFGISPIALLVYEVLFTAVEVFQHSNWAIPVKVDRLIAHLLITPNLHRVHHSQIVKETNSNYGSLLSIWDRVFGTFRYCRRPKTIKLGLIEERRQLSIRDLLILPF
jgi:sterol desaturase/sphingolipid hydroxylase (fatty acid hydroxylase superfamily)